MPGSDARNFHEISFDGLSELHNFAMRDRLIRRFQHFHTSGPSSMRKTYALLLILSLFLSVGEAAAQQRTKQKRSGSTYVQRTRYNARGYRIQIYTGGNKRTDKTQAQRIQQKCRQTFPELATYVHFVSPHWVCRVGDFPKRESAQKYVKKIRAKKICPEVRIVKSNIFVAR